jgi:hypothetical protein
VAAANDGRDADPPAGVERVTQARAAHVAELLALAFYDDPTWSWAFPAPERRMDDLRAWWGLFMHSAVPYGRSG